MASTSGEKDPDPCPICLQQIKQEAYLDRCFHAFCYPCIVQWSRVVTKKQSETQSSLKCPLCKTDNLSIVHGFHGEFFQQHYISTGPGKSWFSSSHEFRLQWYGSDVQISNSLSLVQQFWKRHKYRQRNICLQRWLEREIQAITQEEDVDIIVHHIQGIIESFFRRQQQKGMKDARPEEIREEFCRLLLDAAKPFLVRQTERLVAEVELFLASGLTIEAYDKIRGHTQLGITTATVLLGDRGMMQPNHSKLNQFSHPAILTAARALFQHLNLHPLLKDSFFQVQRLSEAKKKKQNPPSIALQIRSNQPTEQATGPAIEQFQSDANIEEASFQLGSPPPTSEVHKKTKKKPSGLMHVPAHIDSDTSELPHKSAGRVPGLAAEQLKDFSADRELLPQDLQTSNTPTKFDLGPPILHNIELKKTNKKSSLVL